MTGPDGPPRIVLVTKPVVTPIANAPVFAGAVIGPAEGSRPNLLWLDLNILGARILQMYGESEVEDATPELLDAHHLCRVCSGYGLPAARASIVSLSAPDPPVCDSCGGSGNTKWRTEITHTADGVEGRITEVR